MSYNDYMEGKKELHDSKMKEVMDRFSYHKPNELAVNQMKQIRSKVRELAALIQDLCPESREKATSLTQLSFTMMSANSAIVQTLPVDPADV